MKCDKCGYSDNGSGDWAHICGPVNIKAGADIHAGDGGYEESTHEKYEAFVKVRNQSLNKARIRDFERQSGLEIFGLGARREIWEAALEKYAELIVEEMYVFMCDSTDNDKPWPSFKEVKEHFGVEE